MCAYLNAEYIGKISRKKQNLVIKENKRGIFGNIKHFCMHFYIKQDSRCATNSVLSG